MAHTPGPWEIEPKERRDHPLYVMSGEGDRIAKCDGLNMADFGPNPEQAKANARLISAAPDLLVALRKCASALDDMLGDSDRIDGDERPGVLAMQAAMRAFAKAEGNR